MSVIAILQQPSTARERPPLREAQYRFSFATYFPITRIWKEFGIIGGRGPRIQAGVPGAARQPGSCLALELVLAALAHTRR